MKRTKTEKGITLIALIITVIILLILAVVAIGAVQNDGIIQHAKNARDEYNQAQQNEQTILQNYVDILDNETENKPEPEDSLVAMYKAGKIKVGDYVDYTPTTASAVNPDGTEAPGTLTGYTDEAQSIVQEDLNWRVLGYDKTKNELLLISGSPTKTTNGEIYFYGHTGYNNYEDVLNTTCSKLYSNSTLGVTARSITMNDIDTYLGGSAFDKTSFGGGSSSEGGYGYNNPSVSSKFSVDEDTGRLTKLDTPVTLDLTSTAYYYTAADVITDATKLEILRGKDRNYLYCVASRSVYVDSCGASWCYDGVDNGIVGSYGDFCFSDGGEYARPPVCLRPVVSLTSSVTTKDVSVLETAPTGKPE